MNELFDKYKFVKVEDFEDFLEYSGFGFSNEDVKTKFIAEATEDRLPIGWFASLMLKLSIKHNYEYKHLREILFNWHHYIAQIISLETELVKLNITYHERN